MSDRLIRDAVLAAFDEMDATTTATALVAQGVAILYGRMATPAQRFAAETAACRTPGVRAVLNHIEVDVVEDTDMATALAASDALAAIEDLAGDPLCVSVLDGLVTLHGEVPEESQRIVPEQELLRLAEVSDVRNLLHVRGSGGPMERLIHLLAREHVTIGGLSAELRDGELELSGAAQSWFDRDAAERLGWTLPSVRTVANHITFPEETAPPEGG
jgi:osmotically-inducible protein OsmY